MRQEMDRLLEQLKETWEGDPWFGRNGKLLLDAVDEKTAFTKLNGQHSILELVWHMYNWKAFAINRLQPDAREDLKHFEEQDWRKLDHTRASLWQEGLQKLKEAQASLIAVLQELNDAILDENVRERNYNKRKLISGIIHHDIYHLGQIAFIRKQFPLSR